MSKNLKSIYNNIINNSNPQANIPEFFEIAVEQYYTYATVRLALNYYSSYEIYWDERENWSYKPHEYIKDINSIVLEAVLQIKSKEEQEPYIKRIDEIRRSITSGMEILTHYTDLFEIYEYTLDRVEYRFKEIEELEEDENIAKEVLHFIFDDEDNALINDRIKDIVGQLPVRITKQKYYDYISDGLHELLGADKDIFDTYIYLIRSCAMLDVSQDMKDAYPELWEKKEKLERLDFKTITREEYEAASLLVEESVELLELETTAFYVLIELVNELYTCLLCAPYIGQASEDENQQRGAALHIIDAINSAFSKDKQEEATPEILTCFELIEGIQEDMEYDLISYEDALYHIDKYHGSLVESMGKKELLHSLLTSKDLHSSSFFVDLHSSNSGEIVDKPVLRKEIDKLIKELDDIFRVSDRMITRAIMANTMNQMPVFFNSHTEVMEYVLYSLNKCTDLAEKYASIEMIYSMMDE